jgi:hypothetical protein
MKSLRRFLPMLFLIGIITLTIVPSVLADSGPQGGSNSGTPRPPPPPPPPPGMDTKAYLIWLMFLNGIL